METIPHSNSALSDAILDLLIPPPDRGVAQWADEEAYIPQGDGPWPGKYKAELTPYAIEPMDAFSDPDVESVTNMWASQLGKTAVLRNVAGYFASDDPSPMLVVRETDDEVRNFSQERITPFFRDTPALNGRLAEGEKNAKNKTQFRAFPGGYIAFASAGSIAALSSRAIRIALCDEVDRYRTHINTGENPLKQIRQRLKTYRGRRKIGYWSTPGVADLSEIEKLYKASDQRQYHVPCPHCGERFVMQWEHVRYRDENNQPCPEDAWLECPECLGRIEDHQRRGMVAAGVWIPRHPERVKNRGYQLSAIYSPFTTLAELAAEWVELTSARDSLGIVDFYGLQLGLPAPQQGTAIHAEALDQHLEHYEAEVPEGVLILTCAVDTQDHRLEAEVAGWGLGRERWGIRYVVIPGDTSQPGPWAALDELLSRTWHSTDGRELYIRCTVVDSLGHRSNQVWRYCKAREARNVFAIRGRGGEDSPVLGRASRGTEKKPPVYPVGTLQTKAAVFSSLMVEEPGPGYWHYPSDPRTGYDEEYYRGLLSERRVPYTVAGRTKVRWVQTRKRNEPLDIAGYNIAAFEIINPNMKRLAKLQAERLKKRKQQKTTPAATSPPPARRTNKKRPQRRILSRGIK